MSWSSTSCSVNICLTVPCSSHHSTTAWESRALWLNHSSIVWHFDRSWSTHLVAIRMDSRLGLLDESLSEKGLVGLTLSLSPHIYPDDYGTDFHFEGTSATNHCPSVSLDVSSSVGLSLRSWPWPTWSHPKGLSSSYPGHFFPICFYHPDLPIPAAGIFFSLSRLLPRSTVILELPSLAHPFLFLASKSPTSEGFGIHWGSGTLPREPGSTDLEDWESDRFPQQVNSVHVLKWSVHILRSFGYRSTLFFLIF